MRKSTIFISAVLTTFALVVLYRVAAAYSDNRNTTTAAAPTSLPASTATQPPADIQANAAPALGPVDAAQLAAKVIGNSSLLSAESSNYNGINAYKVTFTNNDVVYVGLDGKILSVQAAPVTPVAPAVVIAPPAQQNNNRHSNGGGTSSSGGSHEGGGEHEGGDD